MSWLHLGSRVAVLLGVGLWLSIAWAGGAKDVEDEMAQSAFFGFVRDGSGHAITDAKVTANFTTRKIKLIARSDVTGTYFISKLGNNTDPKTVEITCDKDGYTFDKAVPRSAAPTPGKSVEVECYLIKK